MQAAQFQLHAEIEDRHWWFVARRQIVGELIRRVLPPSPHTTVVDVGCGTGANLAALAGDYRCVGIDTSRQAIELARTRFPGVQFVHGFAPADLNGALDQARLVMLMDVLEHVPDDFAVLSSLLAASTPGTYFLLTVPANLSLWSEHDESFGHYRRYDLARFQQVWEGLPVTTLLTSYFNARLFPLVKLVRTWNRRQGQSRGEAGTDFKLPGPWCNRMLTGIFSGESRRLVDAMSGRSEPYRTGVSLLALVRRECGPCGVRQKPAQLAADFFDPAEQRG